MSKKHSKLNEKLIAIICAIMVIISVFVFFTYESSDEHSIVGAWIGSAYDELAYDNWRGRFAFDSDGSGSMIAFVTETGVVFYWSEFSWTIDPSTPNQLRVERVDPEDPTNPGIQYIELEFSTNEYGEDALVMRELGATQPMYVLTRVE